VFGDDEYTKEYRDDRDDDEEVDDGREDEPTF